MIGNRNLIFYNSEYKDSLSLQLHHCGIQHCEPDYHFNISMRPYHIIHFVLEGNGTFVNEQGPQKIQKGEAFFIPAGSSAHYTASHTDPWKYCWVGIYADVKNPYLSSLFQKGPIIHLEMELATLEQYVLSIIAVTDPRAANIESYREADFSGEQFIPITLPSQSLEANSRLLHLMAKLIKTQTENTPHTTAIEDFALAAKSYMDNHYFEAIKIQDVADILHIHPNYLTQVFREKYKQPPKAYLNSLRLHHAALLLTLTDYPISTISDTVGFSNPYHFSRAFKKLFGDSPGNYRKQK